MKLYIMAAVAQFIEKPEIICVDTSCCLVSSEDEAYGIGYKWGKALYPQSDYFNMKISVKEVNQHWYKVKN